MREPRFFLRTAAVTLPRPPPRKTDDPVRIARRDRVILRYGKRARLPDKIGRSRRSACAQLSYLRSAETRRTLRTRRRTLHANASRSRTPRVTVRERRLTRRKASNMNLERERHSACLALHFWLLLDQVYLDRYQVALTLRG